jgi:hypothetical protein
VQDAWCWACAPYLAIQEGHEENIWSALERALHARDLFLQHAALLDRELNATAWQHAEAPASRQEQQQSCCNLWHWHLFRYS